MQLDPDFREFVASFNEHEVRYLVVGGYALAAHGLPRATGDLDVISRDDLVRNKIAADRPQDRADVHRLTRQPRQD
jgi:2-hydroxy-3-keto-5-methylthiopentenyl-1-phosphate phosphatase